MTRARRTVLATVLATDLATGLVIGLVIAAHLAFLVVDVRLPRDLSLAHGSLPDLLASLQAGRIGPWLRSLVGPGGWYTGAYAAVLATLGVRPEVFGLVDLAWLTTVMAGGALLARHLWGPRAGLIAALLLGSLPAVVVLARESWIHLPEAGLVLVAANAWRASPARWRPGPTLVFVLASAAALALRPSGLVWLVPLGLAVATDPARPHPRAWVPGIALVGLLPWLVRLPQYLTAKLEARDRYLADVSPLPDQLRELLGGPGLVAVGLGLLLSLALPRRPGLRLLQAWALLPVLLFAVARAGIDNFILGIVAAALLAAGGLARLSAGGVLLAAIAFALFTVPQWLPPTTPGIAAAGRLLHLATRPALRNTYRPNRAWGLPQLRALIEATCGASACTVAVDQGLSQPYGEEPGHLERIFLDPDRLELVELRAGPPDHPDRIDALIHYDCGGLDAAWRRRYPASLDALTALLADGRLQPAWSRQVDETCRPIWFTPGGEVAHPERLPPGNDVRQRPPAAPTPHRPQPLAAP
ncbi:MAG: hypothetical protein D6798_14795 [Deltaproteobacteria bacterium]|nr:MAG: hypothetical protein D6798_14795 [Deltaproteobacteria bacterium]